MRSLNKLKEYMEQAQITSAESEQLDKEINSASKEVDANKAVLQAEENSRAEQTVLKQIMITLNQNHQMLNQI